MTDKETHRLNLIEKLSNAYGVSGFEDDVLKVARDFAGGFADHAEDSLRNLYLRRKENKGGKPVVMLDAHSDEVGFMIQAIKPSGTLRFIPVGGWINNTMPAHKVLVRNAKGEYIPGIVTSKPAHFMTETEKDKPLDIADMAIDIGAASRDEAIHDFGIRIGEPAVPDVTFEYNASKGIMMGKAFDCRIGCAAMLSTLEELKGEDLNVDVVGTLTSQEEVGERGAKAAVNTVKPDIAVIFEGCPADDTFTEDYMIQTAIRKGPMLRFADRMMITNPRFQRFALSLGEKYAIPVQTAVRTGGSTNGAVVHLSGHGVPTIVIGIPVRYAHSHYGISAMDDFRNSVKLAAAILRALDSGIIASF